MVNELSFTKIWSTFLDTLKGKCEDDPCYRQAWLAASERIRDTNHVQASVGVAPHMSIESSHKPSSFEILPYSAFQDTESAELGTPLQC